MSEGGASEGGASGAHASGGKAGMNASSGAGGKARAGDGQGASAGEDTAGNGNGGEGGEAGACAACPSGLCLPSGECIDCLASNDQCPDGKYCADDNTCVPGCKNAASCASGVCGETHDCQSCISDSECSDQHVCGAQVCATACTAAREGGNPGCGAGLTCCSLHCVDTVADNQHCGACGTACTASQFCGASGCVVNQLSSLCEIAKVVVILDGQAGDDPTGRALAQSLVEHCAPAPTVREVSQTVADALNPESGRPVAGGDELMVVAGGSVFQLAANYLVGHKLAPVINAATNDSFEIRNSSDNALIASELISNATEDHDLFVVQFMREPTSGSLVLNAYGFTVGGTAAATLYFQNALAPSLAAATKSWYVGEWTDQNSNHTPDAIEITLIASGG